MISTIIFCLCLFLAIWHTVISIIQSNPDATIMKSERTMTNYE